MPNGPVVDLNSQGTLRSKGTGSPNAGYPVDHFASAHPIDACAVLTQQSNFATPVHRIYGDGRQWATLFSANPTAGCYTPGQFWFQDAAGVVSLKVVNSLGTIVDISGGGGGTAGGSNTHVQFNDGGSFGGDSDFTWDKTNNVLTVNGRLRLPHITAPTPVDGDIWTQTDGVYFRVNGQTLSLPTTIATQTANTIFAGPTTGSPAAPTFRTLVAADLPIFNSGAAGAVPASGGGTTNFLRADGTWASTSGSGTAIGGWEFYYSWQCGADTGWKKIADITVGTEVYAGAAYDIEVIDSDTDQGAFVSAKIMTFIARVTRSTGVLDTPNDGGVSGPVADYIRVERVSTGVYEIHFRSPVEFKNVSVRARLNHKLGTVTTTWRNLTAITGTGTLYTPALGHTHLFPWITAYRITNLTTNGFVKTSGGDGTITIDTNTYLTANQTITLSGDVSGSGTTAITTTLASVITAGGPTGSASVVPVITYDAKGRLTAVTTATITPAAIGAATSTHTHGNITNAGAIGSTANLPIITTTGGVLTTGAFGTTANTFCQGNDSRLSDARTPTAHVLDGALHTISGKTAGQALIATGATTFAFTTIGGDATLDGSGTLTLASTITAGGPVGSTSVIPVITYDAKGRLTAVTTATITPAAIGAQPLDGDLTAIAAQTGTGILVRTGTDTWTTRTITVATGLSIANPGGVGGTIQISPANDLAALESISASGFAARTATDTWSARTLTAPAAGFTIANPAGVSGNPVFTLSDDLAGVEGLSTTGVVVRTAANTWTTRTVTGTTNQITVVDGDGVAGAPTISLPSFVVLGSSPSTAPTAPNGAPLHIVAADGSHGGLCGDGWGATNGLVLLGRLSGGTRAVPTATSSGSIIVNIVATGYAGGYLTPVYARYRQVAKNTWSATDRSTFHQWDGTPTGSTSVATWMTLDGGRLSVLSSEASTSTTTGACVITGGVGIGGSLFVGSTVVTAASTTSAAGLRLPHGAAPTSPTNGDIWTTTTGLFARINGATVGPFTAGGVTGTGTANQVAYWSGTSALTGSANFTYNGTSLTFSATNTATSGTTTASNFTGTLNPTAVSTAQFATQNAAIVVGNGATTNVGTAIGYGMGASNQRATATVTALIAVDVDVNATTASGTTTSAIGQRITVRNVTAGHTITTATALQIPAFTATGTITNRFAIDQIGASDLVRFAGRTLVLNNTAATTTTDGALAVSGGISAAGAGVFGGAITSSGAGFFTGVVRSKGAGAGIQINNNAATGAFDLSLVPANLSSNQTVTFANASGTVALGTGTNTQIAFWNATNTLTSSPAFVYNGTSMTLAFTSIATSSATTMANFTATLDPTSASTAQLAAQNAAVTVGNSATTSIGTAIAYSIGAANNRSAATVASLRGMNIDVNTNAGSGTTTEAVGIRLVVRNTVAGHTITNGIGLEIRPFSATGTITNRYAIDQQGASDLVRFAGRTFVLNSTAATTTTDGALAVTGGASIGGAVIAGSHIIAGGAAGTTSKTVAAWSTFFTLNIGVNINTNASAVTTPTITFPAPVSGAIMYIRSGGGISGSTTNSFPSGGSLDSSFSFNNLAADSTFMLYCDGTTWRRLQ